MVISRGGCQFPNATVLIIDDSDTMRQKVKKALENASLIESFLEAGDGLQGMRLLQKHKVDLVVCDVVMPNYDGFQFLSSRATHPKLLDIPVILLTSESEVSKRIQGLEMGANDYILKPFDPGELTARVKIHLRIKLLQQELKERNELLQHLAGTDDLTGLHNRRRFMEMFTLEFSRALRYQIPLSLVLFDVDFFKQINDRLGHLAGDQVLSTIGSAMKSNIRNSDILGRYGGEEFGLVLPHTQIQGAVISAERIRRQIEKLSIPVSNQAAQVTVSGGVTCHPMSPASRIEDLLKQADEALYRAKAAGRNRIECA